MAKKTKEEEIADVKEIMRLKQNVREAARDAINARSEQSNYYQFLGMKFGRYSQAQKEADLEKYVKGPGANPNHSLYNNPMPSERPWLPVTGTNMSEPTQKLAAARKELHEEMARQHKSVPPTPGALGDLGRTIGTAAVFGGAALLVLALVAPPIGPIVGGGCRSRWCCSGDLLRFEGGLSSGSKRHQLADGE